MRREGEVGPLKIKGDFNDLYDRDFELVGSPDTCLSVDKGLVWKAISEVINS